MYFKSLEIFGFKSFLNKTKLKFEPGVTAIVGPNGCGKSNVVDAIKWVLGDQSPKSMRSAAMQDIIFNGTEKYDPLNMSEVSLTLSNEDRVLPVDYDEVTISRRLYRSGESDYLLNKMPVRLSDIRSLLMGTGIGTSSYSVVEQGKMDMILSSRPEERRYLFEEASGITRYKTKKREATLKLDRTKENLVRINDIVREVERQIKSIERKARKAERYKVRFDELKDLDVKLACRTYKGLGTDDGQVASQNDELKKLCSDLSSQVETASSDLSDLRKTYDEIYVQLQTLQNGIVLMTSDMDKNTHVIQINGERIKELEKYVERLDYEIEEATERKDSLKSRLDGAEARYADIRDKREKKNEELVACETDVKGVSDELERYKQELNFKQEKNIDMVSRETRTRNLIIKIDANAHNAESRQKRLSIEKERVVVEKESLSGGMKEVEEKLRMVIDDLESKKKEFNGFNEEYSLKQQEMSSLKNEKSEKEKRINEIRPRRQFLEKLINEREGMNSSVKVIIERVESGDPVFEGVKGILAELINVDEAYQESMESILGDISQAVVVDTRETSDKIVAYLSERSMESANFIVLEELSEMQSDSEDRDGLDSFMSIIMAEEPYRSALCALMGETFVAGASGAEDIYRASGETDEIRIVGEKGEISQRGMRRSRNYSAKDVVPVFGRREKVEQMIQEEEEILCKITELDESIRELEKWVRDSSSRKADLESGLREKQMEFADASSKMSVVKDKFNSLTAENTILEGEIDDVKENIKKMSEEKKQLEEELEILNVENRNIQKAIAEAQVEIGKSAHNREQSLFKMAEIKAELSILVKEDENLSENLERDREVCQRLEREVEERRERIQESGERIKVLTREGKDLEEKNIELKASQEVKSREISEKAEEKDGLFQKIQASERSVRGKEQQLETARDKARDFDIQKKELEYKRDALVQKIQSAYKEDITAINVEVDENINWDETAARVAELKEQLEKMGEVSLGVVEEHKQLEERYSFLSKQRDDLETARSSLIQTIIKINRTTKSMFLETFEKIQKEFHDYFRMLFNGGKAELILEDESNVLECGIDIVVRPPGKKLHNIMQLSGGEKAMTAIALIFAIFKVNPSPFCILDEIDAPLDESNIVRFCQVLQEFLKLSQFIIVTHNRMTIQLADILYGITMAEKGVSKVVSVKFSDDEVPVEDQEAVTAGA